MLSGLNLVSVNGADVEIVRNLHQIGMPTLTHFIVNPSRDYIVICGGTDICLQLNSIKI